LKIKAWLQDKVLKHYKAGKKYTLHPDNGEYIQYKFTCNGKHYYQYVHDHVMARLRYSFLSKFNNETFELKINSDTLNSFMDKIIELCNSNKSVEAGRLAYEVKERSEWLIEPEALYKLASVFYFDLNEKWDEYDEDYNAKKIDDFKKKDLIQYFLKELSNVQEDFLESSKLDLATYIQNLQETELKQLRDLEL
jgi:hypothetical protein